MKFGLCVPDGEDRQSHPARGAWIEMPIAFRMLVSNWSHPARGAWIEIQPATAKRSLQLVAPRKGCVD